MGSMPIITVIPEAVDTTLFQPSFLLQSHDNNDNNNNNNNNSNTNASSDGVGDSGDDDGDRDVSSSLLSIAVDQDGLSSDLRTTMERNNRYIDITDHTDNNNNNNNNSDYDDEDDAYVGLNKYMKAAIKKSIVKGCVMVYDHSSSSSNDDDNNNKDRSDRSSDRSNDRRSSYSGKIECKEGMKFEFLSIFKWEYRKGWDLLLNAYWTAFKPSDNVVLRLRTYVPSFEG